MDQGSQQMSFKVGDKIQGLHAYSAEIVELANYSHGSYARIRTNRPFHPGETELMWVPVGGLEKKSLNNQEKIAAFDAAQIALRAWVDRRGQDKCWYYPDVFNMLTKILEVDAVAPQELPHPDDFDAGCKKYQSEIYKGNL